MQLRVEAAVNRFAPALFALVLVGCGVSHPASNDVRIDCDVSPQPVRVGLSAVTLRLADSLGVPVSGGRVAVEADMSHPGMAPVFSTAKEVSKGQYQAPVGFNMAGDWALLLHVTLPDGRKIEREIAVKGVMPR